ncbi:MAG: bifunctional riboflavin kinase/FAD synthetase [Alphaproteobacteria bacterium]|nr:bifunctional riboflavin kinase/FAD synthetase [Alphaproteobacteria bacterium SS10]
MKLYRNPSDLGTDAQGGAVVIGNFDGVHRGHQALIDAAKGLVEDAPVGVLSFEPHPRQFFKPDTPPFRLTLFRQKARLLQRAGVGHFLVRGFNQDLANQSAEQFVEEHLLQGFRARHVVVGADFKFGKGRTGNPNLLAKMMAEAGGEVTVLGAVGDEVGTLSSSRVRDALIEGDVAEAASILGRPFDLGGMVQKGAQRGRTMEFPTANISLDEALQRPAYGVYAVTAAVSSDSIEADEPEHWWQGVANFGKRPTVDGVQELLEVHLFDVQPDLYDSYLRVQLHHFIRPEQKFDGVEALKRQIELDAAAAKTELSKV